MGELNCIVFNCEIILKWKSFIVLFWIIFILQIISLIIYVETFPSPTLFYPFITFQRIHARFHPMIIKWVWFVLNNQISTRLTILNLAMKLCLLFFTLKLNHWVNPPVLISFCNKRSYSLIPFYFISKLPCRQAWDCQTKSWNQIKADHLSRFQEVRAVWWFRYVIFW